MTHKMKGCVEGAPLLSRPSPSRRRLTWAAGGAIVAPGGGAGVRGGDGERAFGGLTL